MSNMRVLIVGASVAGPMAAYWFAKAGAQVTIIERFPELRRGGQNIDIRTIGVTVMMKIPGMEKLVRENKAPLEGIELVRDDGSHFATMTSTGDPNQQSLVSEYEIFRGDLSKILFDFTNDLPNVRYVFNEQVASIQQHGDEPVTVQFMNNFPETQFDLVVACDGSTSRTRAIGLGCGVRDHIIPLNAWSAFFTLKEDLLEGSKVGQGLSWVPGRFVAVGPHPSGVDHVNMTGIHPSSQGDATLPFREASKKGTDDLKRYVANFFQSSRWKLPELLKGMMESDDFYASEICQVKVPRLYKGRFVLVGDAGYGPGPTGNGTSLAMGGAYVLAGEVATHKGDLTAGLQAYEDRMKPIIEDMQKIPAGFPGVMAPQTAWGLWLRNLVFAALCWGMQFGKYFSWVMGLLASSFGKDKFNIPDYNFTS